LQPHFGTPSPQPCTALLQTLPPAGEETVVKAMAASVPESTARLLKIGGFGMVGQALRS